MNNPMIYSEIILSIHFFSIKMPTPPKPELSPDCINLYVKSFALINLTEQPFHLDS